MGYFEQNPFVFLAAVTVIAFLSGWLGSEARAAIHHWLDDERPRA